MHLLKWVKLICCVNFVQPKFDSPGEGSNSQHRQQDVGDNGDDGAARQRYQQEHENS